MELGYEEDLFKTADKLRNKVSPADYKYYVLPLLFIRFASESDESSNIKLTDRHLWNKLCQCPEDLSIAQELDNALVEIGRDNPALSDALIPVYVQSGVNEHTLRELVGLVDSIKADSDAGTIDLLGRTYEYFISNFASNEGNRGGEFFTPSSVVKLLSKMLAPKTGLVFDPACGTGGMFVQSDRDSSSHLTFYGQEINPKTLRLAKMNAALHGLNADIRAGDSLLEDQFESLRADYIISNPPFNQKDWGAERLPADDPRVILPINAKNANYMWILDYLYHLSPKGKAGFVISNGALTSTVPTEVAIRKYLIENDYLDCVVQLPGKMFFGTAIPCALIFLSKQRPKNKKHVLFIDATKLGQNESKRLKVFGDDDIDSIVRVYRDYEKQPECLTPQKGFCVSASYDTISDNGYKIMPSLYSGVEDIHYDREQISDEIRALKALVRTELFDLVAASDVLLEMLEEDDG